MKYRPELIAPAGNFEKLQFAFKYGADGAYLGGKQFNLRFRAGNFTFSELKKAVTLSAKYNKKIYFTLNIYFKNKDFLKLGQYCEKLLKTGITNIIISDIGVLNFINKNFKDLFHISISTQANITNFYTADILKKLNVNRIIPARELSLKEIKQIKERIDIELETFIHGAICVSYSGRCLLSEYLAGRNANKGDCTQPCRWDYYLVEKTRRDEHFPVIEDKDSTTILSSKDLCTLFILDKLIKLKINAFKIEGRMKSLYYVANVTRVYRQAINNILGKKESNTDFLFNELDSVSHRPYFEGFFKKNTNSISYDRSYMRKYKFIGYLKRRVKDNLYELVLKDKVETSDRIEIILPEMFNIKMGKFKLYDKNLNKTDRGIINNKFFIEVEDNADLTWGIVRKQFDDR